MDATILVRSGLVGLLDASVTPIQNAALLAHSSSSGYRLRIARSMQLLNEYPGYAVSVSWGKDSVVMLHMAARHGHRVMAVHGRYSSNEELPDIRLVRDGVLSMIDIDYVETPVRGDWEVAEIVGHPLWEAETLEQRVLLKKIRIEFVNNLEVAAVGLGAVGMAIGLSAHESRARRFNAAIRGHHYCVAGRLPTLAPLQWLTPDDVLAYHIEHGLPWLHIYDVADDPRRARSELSMATGAGDPMRRMSQWNDLRAAYPDLCSKWIARWPDWCGR